MTDPFISIGGNADAKVAAMEKAPMMRGTRGTATLAANIAAGDTATVVVPFDTALPVDTYSPQVTLEGTAGLLGQLTAIVKAGGRTKTGCTVFVKNSSLVSVGLNVIVHVTVVY